MVFKKYWAQVLHQAHGHPWARHQRRARTFTRVLEVFFWPGVSQDAVRFCHTCPLCQVATRRGPAKAPLNPMPIIDTTFKHITMNLVGTRSSWGFQYILVLMDYATRYPEVIAL